MWYWYFHLSERSEYSYTTVYSVITILKERGGIHVLIQNATRVQLLRKKWVKSASVSSSSFSLIITLCSYLTRPFYINFDACIYNMPADFPVENDDVWMWSAKKAVSSFVNICLVEVEQIPHWRSGSFSVFRSMQRRGQLRAEGQQSSLKFITQPSVMFL